jgi:hypothetical protein
MSARAQRVIAAIFIAATFLGPLVIGVITNP